MIENSQQNQKGTHTVPLNSNIKQVLCESHKYPTCVKHCIQVEAQLGTILSQTDKLLQAR